MNIAVSSSASVLSSLVRMRSGPVALCSLSVDSNLCSPFYVIVMCCICGCGLMPLPGMVVMSSFRVNTDGKCCLSILALDWLSNRMKLSAFFYC